MLSIQAMKGGQGAYYLDLAQEDYYLEGGEPPGLWWGQGAKALHLQGQVERKELERMLKGFAEDGTKLTQNAGRESRKPGWDLTFSAPKSVSVLWSQADGQTRAAIQAAHLAAVQAGLTYLENEASFSRRGKGGHEQERAGLCVSLFEHGTSRAGDPQLHTHCLGMNVGVRPDGTTGTVVSQLFYHHKMTAGAVYRAQLAYELRERLGLVCQRERTWFELAGVPKSLCDFFSQRRQQIKEKLGELGMETASAAAFAALETRNAKTLVAPRQQLFREWREAGPEHEFGSAEVRTLLDCVAPIFRAQTYQGALAEAVHEVTRGQSHFSEQEILRRTLEAAQGTGLDAPFVQGWVKHDLETNEQFIKLGERNGEDRYTTREILEQEKRLFEMANYLRWRHGQAVSAYKMDELATLRSEQRRAVEHLTEKVGAISILAGVAGTGKTTTLEACRKRWEAAGLTVVGAALAGKAAEQLEDGSGIRSCTLESLRMRMHPSAAWTWEHHATQLWRAARGKPTYQLKPLEINEKTVLVIDEAGMVGTAQMTRILEEVSRQGGKVVLVGDAKQLQPIEWGTPFAALAQRLGYAELKEIVRQRDERDRQVVRDMAAGKTEDALKSLDERRLVSVTKTRADAASELVTTWSREIGFEAKKSLIFCSTNEEAADLNRQCQAQQSLRRRTDSSRSIAIHESRAYVGDRVLCTQNSSRLGVRNGDLGTVQAIHRVLPRATIRLDSGEIVTVVPQLYVQREDGACALRLGYAITTHKGQGSTVDYAYVLAGGSMQDREISYVQLSRARVQTRVFVDQQTAGKNLEGLTRQMDRSRAKDMASDVLREQQEHHRRLRLSG